MAGAIAINILSNVREAVRGVDNVADALEDAEGRMRDLTEEGDTASARMEADFKSTATAADASSDKIRRVMREAYRDVRQDAVQDLDRVGDEMKSLERQSELAGRSIGDIGEEGGRGLDRIKGGAQELQQELGQNLGEAVSSIRGDITDLGQVGQDTLGGLAATIAGTGPAGIVGAAALAAGAVGLGLVTAELQRQQEEAEKVRERISGMYQAAAEDGRAYIDTAQLIAEANSVMFDPDRADEWKQLQKEARELGLENSTLIAANAGDMQAQEEVQGRINALVDEERQKRENMGAFLGGQNKNQEEQRLEGLAERWAEIGRVTEDNAAKARDAADVTDRYLRNAIQQAGTATEEVDAFGNKLLTLPDGEQVVIDADTGQAHQDLDRFKGDVDGVANKVSTKTIKLVVDDKAWRDYDPGTKRAIVRVGVPV